MEPEAIRALFHEYVGVDRYQKFVRVLNRDGVQRGQLRYWQAKLWEKFQAEYPTETGDQPKAFDLFRVCDIHDCPLDASNSSPLPTNIRNTEEYAFAANESFPFFGLCSMCSQTREAWVAANPEICSILRCETTYEDFCRRWLGEISTNSDFIRKIKQRDLEIAKQMKPGDTLWEWDKGGWHHLAGAAGVAIVRDGEIIKEWCEFRS